MAESSTDALLRRWIMLEVLSGGEVAGRPHCRRGRRLSEAEAAVGTSPRASLAFPPAGGRGGPHRVHKWSICRTLRMMGGLPFSERLWKTCRESRGLDPRSSPR